MFGVQSIVFGLCESGNAPHLPHFQRLHHRTAGREDFNASSVGVSRVDAAGRPDASIGADFEHGAIQEYAKVEWLVRSPEQFAFTRGMAPIPFQG